MGKRAVQPADKSEVQFNSVLVFVDVGSPGLQSNSKPFENCLRKAHGFCRLMLLCHKTCIRSMAARLEATDCEALLTGSGAGCAIGASRSYRVAAGKASCGAHWPDQLLFGGLCRSVLAFAGYSSSGEKPLKRVVRTDRPHCLGTRAELVTNYWYAGTAGRDIKVAGSGFHRGFAAIHRS